MSSLLSTGRLPSFSSGATSGANQWWREYLEDEEEPDLSERDLLRLQRPGEEVIDLFDDRQAYQTRLETGAALEQEDDGKLAPGLLTSFADAIDRPRAEVFNLARELFDDEEGFDYDRWRERVEDREAFRDLEWAKPDEDAGWGAKAAAGVGRFLGDALLDPLTYFTGGGSMLGRRLGASAVAAQGRKLAPDALEGVSGQVLRKNAARVSPEEMAARMSTKGFGDQDQLLLQGQDALLDLAERQGLMSEFAQEGLSRGMGQAYATGGSTRLRRFLDDSETTTTGFGKMKLRTPEGSGLGRDLGRDTWKDLPAEFRGGVGFRVPGAKYFAARPSDGKRLPVRVTIPGTGGGRGLEKLQLGFLHDLSNGARTYVRLSPFGRTLNKLSGQSGQMYGAMLEDTAKKLYLGKEAFGAGFGRFEGVERSLQNVRAWVDNVDETLNTNMAEVEWAWTDGAARYGANGEDVRRRFNELANDPALLRQQVAGPMPSEAGLAPTGDAAEELAQIAARRLLDAEQDLYGQLQTMMGDDWLGFINDHAPRMLAREAREKMAEQSALTRRRSGKGSGSYDPTKARQAFVRRLEYDPETDTTRPVAWMTVDEANEAAGEAVFNTDAFSAANDYLRNVRRLARRERLLRSLVDNGLASRHRMATEEVVNRSKAGLVAGRAQAAIDERAAALEAAGGVRGLERLLKQSDPDLKLSQRRTWQDQAGGAVRVSDDGATLVRGADGSWTARLPDGTMLEPERVAPPVTPKPWQAQPGADEAEEVSTSWLKQLAEHDRRAAPHPMRDPGYLDTLKADIAERGIEEPLMVTVDPKSGLALLDEGNHRLAAALELGMDRVPVRISRGYVDKARGVDVPLKAARGEASSPRPQRFDSVEEVEEYLRGPGRGDDALVQTWDSANRNAEDLLPELEPTLPRGLEKAAPRYRDAAPRFASDVDRAVYIVTTAKGTVKSRADRRYLDWLESLGLEEEDILRRGRELRDDLKGRYEPGSAPFVPSAGLARGAQADDLDAVNGEALAQLNGQLDAGEVGEFLVAPDIDLPSGARPSEVFDDIAPPAAAAPVAPAAAGADLPSGFATRKEAEQAVTAALKDTRKTARLDRLEDLRDEQVAKLAADREFLGQALESGTGLGTAMEQQQFFDDLVETAGRYLDANDANIYDRKAAVGQYREWAKAQGKELLSDPQQQPMMAARIEQLGLFGPEEVQRLITNLYRARTDLSGAQQWVRNVWQPMYAAAKAWMTAGRTTGYIARNVIGSAWNSWLYDVQPVHFKRATAITGMQRKARRAAGKQFPGGSPMQLDRATDKEFRRLAAEHFGGEADEVVEAVQAFQRHVLGPNSAGSRTQGVIARELGDVRGGIPEEELTRSDRILRAAGENPWIRYWSGHADRSETYGRLATFLKGVDEFGLDDGGYAAGIGVKATQFDYQDLTQSGDGLLNEQNLKQLWTFYTFSRFSVPLQFRALMYQPGKVAKLLRSNEELREMFGDPEAEAEHAKGRWTEDRMSWVSRWRTAGGYPLVVGIESPLMDLNRLFLAPDPSDALDPRRWVNWDEVTSQANPFLTQAADWTRGVDSFTRGQRPSTQEAAGWARYIPGLTQTTPDGDEVMSTGVRSAVENLVPPVGLLSRLAPGTLGNERGEVRRLSSYLSTFGALPVATLDPWQESAELRRRSARIDRGLEGEVDNLSMRRAYAQALLNEGVPAEQVAAGWSPRTIDPYDMDFRLQRDTIRAQQWLQRMRDAGVSEADIEIAIQQRWGPEGFVPDTDWRESYPVRAADPLSEWNLP